LLRFGRAKDLETTNAQALLLGRWVRPHAVTS
jgi:hypothetical protein